MVGPTKGIELRIFGIGGTVSASSNSRYGHTDFISLDIPTSDVVFHIFCHFHNLYIFNLFDGGLSRLKETTNSKVRGVQCDSTARSTYTPLRNLLTDFFGHPFLSL